MLARKARCKNAMVSPVASIRLNARCLFHVENTSPTLSVLSTALHGAVLSIPANCYVARQLKPSVPHASIDATDSPLCKACQPIPSSTVRYVAAHLEVFSAELLHFPRLAIVLDDPSEELLDDLRVWRHEVLREGRATGFARWLPRHCLLDLPHHQRSQLLHLFLELFGIELLSIAARR